MKKNSKTPKLPAAKSTAVAVVESPDKRKANEISAQYGVLAAKGNDFRREAIKFGSLLVEWEQFLGKSNAGRSSSGEGLKGWLEQYCPEINYTTAIKYKLLAEKNAQMLGGGAMAIAALQGETTVTQPDGEVIDVEAKVIEKRDEIFAEANSFSKLEQMWFDLFGPGDKPKAKKEAKPLPKLSQRDAAKSIWNIFMQQATRRSLKDAIPLLGEKETQTCYDDLRDLVELLKSHLKEF